MTRVISLRLPDDQAERLGRAARDLGRTPEATAALLIDESLRLREFPQIEFRDAEVGRQPFLRGSRLKVWQVVMLVRDFGDVRTVSEQVGESVPRIEAALRYAETFPEEIEAELTANSVSFEELRKRSPGVGLFEFDAAPP